MLPITNNQDVQGLSIYDFETSRMSSLGARAEEAWIRSPFSSVVRSFGLGTFDPLNIMGFQGDDFLRQDEAAKIMAASGVQIDLDEPFVSRKKLDILIQQKIKEARRQSVFLRGPQDGLTSTLGLFTELGVTIADPLNLASAFIPVVGEAQFARLVGRFGKVGARVTRGAIEGTVGAGVVEPFILINAAEEDADYGFANSLLNLGFGAVAGGGLHSVGGALGDIAKRRLNRFRVSRMSERIGLYDPKVREAALRSSVANVAEGRRPNAEMYTREDAANGRVDSPVSPEDAALQGRLVDQVEDLNTPDEAQGDFEVPRTELERAEVAPDALAEGDISIRVDEEGRLVVSEGVDAFRKILDNPRTKSAIVRFSSDNPDANIRFLQGLAGNERARIRLNVKDENEGVIVNDAERKLTDEKTRLESPESSFGADVRAAREAGIREPGIKPGVDEEFANALLQDAEDIVARNSESLAAADPEVREAVGIPDDIEQVPEIAEAKKLAEQTTLREKALRALAACLGRD